MTAPSEEDSMNVIEAMTKLSRHAKTVASNAVAVTPNQFVGTITLNSNPPSDSDGEYGVGEMWIETDTQDIFIRTG